MDDLTALSVEGFLDQLAARSPTPGGGAAAGVAGALACALARMVAAYSVGKRTDSGTRDRVEAAASRLSRADQLIRALVTQDAEAYAAMTQAAANREPQSGHVSSVGPGYAEAVLSAIAVPMEMAAVASNALATMDDFKAAASRYLLSDLGIAAVLADAAARAACYTVYVNAPEVADAKQRTKIVTDIAAIATNCARHLASIEAFVRGHLETDADGGR